MALRRSNSLLGNPSKASGGMSFETAQGPHAAVLAMFPERAERTPLPPIPRLQLTAAEEKTRTTDFKVPSVQERLEYFASMPESSRPQTVGQQSNRPPLPAGLTPGMTVTVPGYTQYTMWYNDSRSAVHATLGMQLKPNTPISIHSPRVAQHTTLRQEAFKSVRDVLGKAIPTNLSQIVHLFMAQVTRQGSTDLTAASVTAALADLDVDDVIVADKFFSLLDVHKSGRVPITTIIAVVDLCINSDLFKARVREHCFNLFNLHGLGYIHSTQLDEVKAIMGKENTFRGSGATANMVRVLGDVFIAARKAEEEDYVNTVLLKKAKKKKKAPPLKPNQKSYIPATMRRIGHLDVDLFSKYFDSSLELASAFFPRYLALLLSDSHLQHASVMRAIALAEEAGQM